MVGGMIEHDTCNTAQNLGTQVESIMIQMAKESGVSNNELARTNGIVTTT
jgi:hypothetical protein